MNLWHKVSIFARKNLKLSSNHSNDLIIHQVSNCSPMSSKVLHEVQQIEKKIFGNLKFNKVKRKCEVQKY